MGYSETNSSVPIELQKTAREVVCFTPGEKVRIRAWLKAEGLAFSSMTYGLVMPGLEAWEKKNGIAPA